MYSDEAERLVQDTKKTFPRDTGAEPAAIAIAVTAAASKPVAEKRAITACLASSTASWYGLRPGRSRDRCRWPSSADHFGMFEQVVFRVDRDVPQ